MLFVNISTAPLSTLHSDPYEPAPEACVCVPAGHSPLLPFITPSVVSGAQKAVKELEQLATADAEAIIDSIEEQMQEAAATSSSSSTGLGKGLAHPVLSKTSQSLTQGRRHPSQASQHAGNNPRSVWSLAWMSTVKIDQGICLPWSLQSATQLS